MPPKPAYKGYKSFEYLESPFAFELAPELQRVEAYVVPLSPEDEARVDRLVAEHSMVSLHEHLNVFPADIGDTPDYVRTGRTATAFEGLAHSRWDAVFDNMLNGICRIHSHGGWQWLDVVHDLGMRLCDVAHQDFLVHVKSVDDILTAKREGRVGWVISLEGAAMIENELDRIEILYGLGVRALGIAYSEANALGAGLKEPRDGGLTVFGRRAVERMNAVGMLIDCSHCGDQTALDTIEVSEKPIILSHTGAQALWNSRRLAPDEVLVACAEKGGVIGIEAAPHTTITHEHREHSLESFMEHFEYVRDLVGIDHVGFGPDTVYGDHVGLHEVYAAPLALRESRQVGDSGGVFEEHPMVPWVKGLENPTEGSFNIVRWLVGHGYTDDEIARVMGGNALRLLRDVWG
jgi:membrane dipeptidase